MGRTIEFGSQFGRVYIFVPGLRLVMASDVIWFYEQNGSHIGPVAADVIRQKCIEGVITGMTLCWQPAFGSDWRPVQSTEFASYLPKGMEPPPLPNRSGAASTPPPVPPPLPNQGGFTQSPRVAPSSVPPSAAVPQMPYAWMIAVTPLFMTIAGIVMESFTEGAATITNAGDIGMTIAFCRMDVKQLRAAGYTNPPSAWWALISPIYLWKRGTLTGDRRPFWVLTGSIILTRISQIDYFDLVRPSLIV